MPICVRRTSSRDLHKITDVHVLPSFSSASSPPCSPGRRRNTLAYAGKDLDYCSSGGKGSKDGSSKGHYDKRKRPFFCRKEMAMAFSILVALLVARISLFILQTQEVTIQSANDNTPTATPAAIDDETTTMTEEEEIQNSIRSACARDEQVLCRRASCGGTYDPFLSILTPGASLAVEPSNDGDYDIPTVSSPSEYCSVPPIIEAHVHEGLSVPFKVLEEAKIEAEKLEGVCLDYKDPNSHWTYQWCHGSSFVRTRPDIFSSSIQETEDFGLFRMAKVGVHAESSLKNGNFLRNSGHRVAREALLDGLVVRQYFDSVGPFDHDDEHHRHRATVELRCCGGQSSGPSFLSVNTDTYNDETAADAIICAPSLCINQSVDDEIREDQEKKLETSALKHLIDTVLDAMNNTSSIYFPEQARVKETMDPIVDAQNMKSQERLVDMVLHSLVDVLTDTASYQRSVWATQKGYQDAVALIMQTSDMTHDQYDFVRGKYTRNGLLKLLKAMLTYKPKKWGRLTTLLSQSVDTWLDEFQLNVFSDAFREEGEKKNIFRGGRNLNVFSDEDKPSDPAMVHNLFSSKKEALNKLDTKEHSNVFRPEASSETQMESHSKEERPNVFRDKAPDEMPQNKETPNHDVRHMEDPKDNLSDPPQSDDNSGDGAFVLNAFEDTDVNQCLSYHEQAQTLLSDTCISAINTARKQAEDMKLKKEEHDVNSSELTEDDHRSNKQSIAEKILLAITLTLFALLTVIVKKQKAKEQPCRSFLPERPRLQRNSSSARFSRRSLMQREDTMNHIKLHSLLSRPSVTELRKLDQDEDGSDDDSNATSICSQEWKHSSYLLHLVVCLNVAAFGMFLFKVISTPGYLDFFILSTVLLICHFGIVGRSN